jgi:hypothetical protein
MPTTDELHAAYVAAVDTREDRQDDFDAVSREVSRVRTRLREAESTTAQARADYENGLRRDRRDRSTR